MDMGGLVLLLFAGMGGGEEETKIREAERARDWSAPRKAADAVRLL